MTAKDEYYVTRNCRNCGNADRFYFSKREMAFELYSKPNIWSAPCSKCGSIVCAGSSARLVQLDRELFKEWSLNENLYVDEQDEDIILAREINLPLMLELLDDNATLICKKQILYSALCVLIYDSINENLVLVEYIKKEIQQRKTDFIVTNPIIMDYIKKVVFPIIGIT